MACAMGHKLLCFCLFINMLDSEILSETTLKKRVFAHNKGKNKCAFRTFFCA